MTTIQINLTTSTGKPNGKITWELGDNASRVLGDMPEHVRQTLIDEVTRQLHRMAIILNGMLIVPTAFFEMDDLLDRYMERFLVASKRIILIDEQRSRSNEN